MPRRRPVGNLPLDALAALSQPHLGLAEGDIFWIPESHLEYHSGKEGRFCVLVALEALSGDDVPTVGHLIVGSTHPEWDETVPEVMVQSGEGGLSADTFFSFKVTTSIELALLREVGRPLDRLAAERIVEIRTAIFESNLVALKRVMKR